MWPQWNSGMRVVCLRCRWCKRTATEKAFTRPEWWVDAGVGAATADVEAEAAEAAAEAGVGQLGGGIGYAHSLSGLTGGG